jgi:transcriptional repressor NrdR
MRCPFCGSDDTQVKDSRVADDGSYIKRRRFCGECGSRFTTFERIQLKEIYVKKSSGVVVPFERDKLLRSIMVACRKRPVDDARIEKIVSSIQRQLEATGEQEISSREIGMLVMEILSSIDVVAYIRFASVYYNFETRDDFLKFIDKVKSEVSEEEKNRAIENASYDKCVINTDFKKNYKDGNLF